MLQAIAQHRVADRPDRFEPRMAKRRPKDCDRLRKPRKEIKRNVLKRFRKNQATFVQSDRRASGPERRLDQTRRHLQASPLTRGDYLHIHVT